MLHDRFYARWDQPLSVVQSGQEFATLIKIKIDRSGHIAGVSLAKSSGNETVDESVLTAAQRVTQVDPLPKGLGDGDGYEVNIEFKLSP
ncbi:MAG: energy transducer TonB [Verrucomicrobia bacterium]|nr:energy transducer TonB [Verrucomicrobiota bacterium]